MLAPRFHLHKAMFFLLAMACATILSAQKPHPASPTYPTTYFRHPLTLPVSMAGGFMSVTYNPSMIQTCVQDLLDSLDGKTVTQDHVIECKIVDDSNVNDYEPFS